MLMSTMKKTVVTFSLFRDLTSNTVFRWSRTEPFHQVHVSRLISFCCLYNKKLWNISEIYSIILKIMLDIVLIEIPIYNFFTISCIWQTEKQKNLLYFIVISPTKVPHTSCKEIEIIFTRYWLSYCIFTGISLGLSEPNRR